MVLVVEIGTEVVVDEDDVDEVDVVEDEVVDGSCVSMMDITELGSTMSTCESFCSRRTSAASSSATKPLTLLANTSLTSLPSEVSLFTFAATLAESFKITMYSLLGAIEFCRAPPVAKAGDTGIKAASNTEQSSALSTRRYATNI
jgi:hypothetical protein